MLHAPLLQQQQQQQLLLLVGEFIQSTPSQPSGRVLCWSALTASLQCPVCVPRPTLTIFMWLLASVGLACMRKLSGAYGEGRERCHGSQHSYPACAPGPSRTSSLPMCVRARAGCMPSALHAYAPFNTYIIRACPAYALRGLSLHLADGVSSTWWIRTLQGYANVL